LISSPEVYVTDTGTALGRGVIAAKRFRAGEVVEISPVVLVDESFINLPKSVQRLVFNWSKLSDSNINFALATGFGSLYNHSDNPNLRYSADSKKNTMIFKTIRNIKAHEQLTINYNQVKEGAEPRKKSWFVSNNVEIIKDIE